MWYVVEFRYPVEIANAKGVKDAASIAARKMEAVIGSRPDLWNARVFVYDPERPDDGPVEEWWSNPSGTEFRKLSQNFDEHASKVENGD